MQQGGTSVASATYGIAGEMLGLNYFGVSEGRTYNTLLQMTRQTVPGMMDMQYVYTAGADNGRVTSTIDGVMGETVNYTYDTVNRLTNAASTAPGGWNQSYTYDGFGNLTAKSAAGAFTAWSINVDPATNHVVGAAYDANGNVSAGTYDVENRLVSNGSTMYAYDNAGKRVMKETWSTPTQAQQEFYFYGVNGQKLVTLPCTNGDNFSCGAPVYNVYFGGKLVVSKGVTVVTDRLGSVRANTNGDRMAYFPYGEERTNTPDNREKFGTYFRDPSSIGPGYQDYADQRYYGVGSGRFYTPDPSGADAADSSDPTSLNMYAYVNGDPINFNDPKGLATCGDSEYYFNGVPMGTVANVLSSGSNAALLATAEYTEASHGPGSNQQEMIAIGDVIMNRWQIVNGYWTLLSGPNTSAESVPVPIIPGWGYPDGNLSSIVMNLRQFGIFHQNDAGDVVLTVSAQANLNAALGSDVTSKLCADLDVALTSALGLWGDRGNHALFETADGLVVTGFNSFNPPRASNRNEVKIGSFGTSGNVFYGIPDTEFDWNLGQQVPVMPKPPRPGARHRGPR
jgi:RHS repeat-associated protein